MNEERKDINEERKDLNEQPSIDKWDPKVFDISFSEVPFSSKELEIGL